MTMVEKYKTNKMRDEDLVQTAFFISGKGTKKAKRSIAKEGKKRVNDILIHDEDLLTRQSCYESQSLDYIENLTMESEDDLVLMMNNLPLITWPFIIDKGLEKVDLMAEYIANTNITGQMELVKMS